MVPNLAPSINPLTKKMLMCRKISDTGEGGSFHVSYLCRILMENRSCRTIHSMYSRIKHQWFRVGPHTHSVKDECMHPAQNTCAPVILGRVVVCNPAHTNPIKCAP